MNKIIDDAVIAEGEKIPLCKLSEVISKEGKWFVSTCPELAVTSQGTNRTEAHAMLVEAVTLWLKYAGAAEIKKQLA